MSTYRGAVQSGARDSTSAFGYALAITTSFGICVDGSTVRGVPQDLLFLGGACFAFLLVVGLAGAGSGGPVGRRRHVDLVALAVTVLAVLCAAGAAALATLLHGTWVWPAGGFGATATYLLVGPVDVLLAREVDAQTGETADR